MKKENRIDKIRQKDLEEGINIAKEPMRVTRVRISDTEVGMIIINQHILYDGWSNGIIIKEFIDVVLVYKL